MSTIKYSVFILLSIIIILHAQMAESRANSDIKVEDNSSLESGQDEDSKPNSIQSITKLSKSLTPFEEDEIYIQIDCLILNVFAGLKMDRETIAVAKNLLGQVTEREKEQLSFPVSSTVDVFLRKVIEATATIKDKSTEDKRITQEQFMALVKMLDSRGFVRILANPTLQIVDGQTAKIQTEQSSIQVTPEILDGDYISLQAQVIHGSQSLPESKEQILNSAKHEISTRIRVAPDESSIIGGIKTIRKNSEAKSDIENSEENIIETLLILTPRITYRWQSGKIVDSFGHEVDLRALEPQSLVGKALNELAEFSLRLELKNTENEIILICFWDINQRPSRNYIIQLVKRAEELKLKDVTVITVQASKVVENTLREWLKENKVSFPVVLVDSGGELIRFNWGVKALPWLILTDKEHIVKAEGFVINELEDKIMEIEK